MSTILLCEVFVILPISYLYLLKGVKSSLPVILLFTVWASDATAYLLGKAIGKRPLLPLISPKKTWEGLIGAIIGSLVIMLISSKVTGLSIGGSVLVGISTGILGQLGDIMESAGKRLYNIKDSSALIPGHGGILDRLDSFTLTAPFLYHYLSWVKI
jgi:phosphatidate cytidylyltransferase